MFGGIFFDRCVECRLRDHDARRCRNYHSQMTFAVTIPEFDLVRSSECNLMQVRVPQLA